MSAMNVHSFIEIFRDPATANKMIELVQKSNPDAPGWKNRLRNAFHRGANATRSLGRSGLQGVRTVGQTLRNTFRRKPTPEQTYQNTMAQIAAEGQTAIHLGEAVGRGHRGAAAALNRLAGPLSPANQANLTYKMGIMRERMKLAEQIKRDKKAPLEAWMKDPTGPRPEGHGVHNFIGAMENRLKRVKGGSKKNRRTRRRRN
jgi:hypothetical protein